MQTRPRTQHTHSTFLIHLHVISNLSLGPLGEGHVLPLGRNSARNLPSPRSASRQRAQLTHSTFLIHLHVISNLSFGPLGEGHVLPFGENSPRNLPSPRGASRQRAQLTHSTFFIHTRVYRILLGSFSRAFGRGSRTTFWKKQCVALFLSCSIAAQCTHARICNSHIAHF